MQETFEQYSAWSERQERRWVVEVLVASRRRLEFGWTQGTLTTTFDGQASPPSENSFQFCIAGAVFAAAAEQQRDWYTTQRLLRALAEAILDEAILDKGQVSGRSSLISQRSTTTLTEPRTRFSLS